MSHGAYMRGSTQQRPLPQALDFEPARIVPCWGRRRDLSANTEQAIEAPMVMPAGSQAVSMRSPTPDSASVTRRPGRIS